MHFHQCSSIILETKLAALTVPYHNLHSLHDILSSAHFNKSLQPAGRGSSHIPCNPIPPSPKRKPRQCFETNRLKTNSNTSCTGGSALAREQSGAWSKAVHVHMHQKATHGSSASLIRRCRSWQPVQCRSSTMLCRRLHLPTPCMRLWHQLR